MIELARIADLISANRLTGTLSGLVNIPSPTGEESTLAAHIVECLQSAGVNAELQYIDPTQANAVGLLNCKKSANNAHKKLLLYSPIDTVTSSNEDEDIPWVGPELRPDMQATAYTRDGHVMGLGAHNPKGHAACVIEASRVLSALGAELSGDVYFGFGAGGMPTHAREKMRADSGHGIGCTRLIEKLPAMDGAIIAKSGQAVTWEEVGFIWMEVSVAGTHTYVGSRHLLPYRNAIAQASKLILRLEDWFEERARAQQTDCVFPQAVISQIEAGWRRMPAFTPACCRFLADLRFGPFTSADTAEAEFQSVLRNLCAELDIEASARRVQTIEASHTDKDDPVVATTIASWEAINGKPHEPFREMSGATDANMLRRAGIPTARVGLPKALLPELDFQLGMNCVSITALQELTLLLVSSALNFCADPAPNLEGDSRAATEHLKASRRG